MFAVYPSTTMNKARVKSGKCKRQAICPSALGKEPPQGLDYSHYTSFHKISNNSSSASICVPVSLSTLDYTEKVL